MTDTDGVTDQTTDDVTGTTPGDEGTTPPPPPPPTGQPAGGWHDAPPAPSNLRRLTREPNGMIGGVCEGLGRFTNLDPVIFRIIFVVLGLSGALGVVLYVVLWLVVPVSGAEAPIVRGGRASGSGQVLRWVGLAVILIAGIGLLTSVLALMPFVAVRGATGWPLLFLVGGVALLWFGQRESHDPHAYATASVTDAPAPPTPPTTRPMAPPPAAGWVPPGDGSSADVAARVRDGAVKVGSDLGDGLRSTVGSYQQRQDHRRERRETRPRSILGRVTVGVILITVAAIAMLDNLGVLSPAPRDYVATALGITGVGLLVGTIYGRSRALIVLGLVLLPIAAATSALPDGVNTSFGERYLSVTAASQQPVYELGIGRLQVDLSDLQPGELDGPVALRLGIGELHIHVPVGVAVELTYSVGAGDVQYLDAQGFGGLLNQRDTLILDGAGPPIKINAELGAGNITIERHAIVTTDENGNVVEVYGLAA